MPDPHITTDPIARIAKLIDEAEDHYLTEASLAVGLSAEAVAALADLPERAETQASALRARALRTHGLALHFFGRHAEGREALLAALAAVHDDNLAQRSSVLRALAIGSELLGDLEDAVAWGNKALAVARSHGGADPIAEALLSVGVCYSRTGDAAAGLAHFEEVLALAEAQGQAERTRHVLVNIGIACKNLGRHEKSVAHLERALALAEAAGDKGTAAGARSNLGESLMRVGRLVDARRVFDVAIALQQASKHIDGETNSRVGLGRVLLELGDLAAAQAELEEALRLCGQTGGRNHAAAAHLALATVHKRRGAHAEALRHHEAYHAAERAQFNAESDRKIGSLRAQREIADARHLAELHRLRHVEIAAAHAELTVVHAALLAAVDEKNRLLVRLAEQSLTDALTGLANRRALDERLADELLRARRHGQPLAVALCDLDFFKRVNDHHGHAVGDAVLRQVATLLRERCRGSDLVARYGGEEFCICFFNTDAEAASVACDALRAAIAAHDWPSVHPGLVVTISIGVADDPDLTAPAQLLARADHQLYRAKHEGKNRVCWRGNAADGVDSARCP